MVISAGDGGSAGCDDFDTEESAIDGLAVSGFASTPYNVAVGGTDFDQTAATAPNYWSATNNADNRRIGAGIYSGDHLEPIVRGAGSGIALRANRTTWTSWAEAAARAVARRRTEAASCLAGYSKPAWQTGNGVPQDGVRDLPDVSLFASAGFNGSFYIMCEADAGPFGILEATLRATWPRQFVGIGGTSASAPSFAGIMALVNQNKTAQGSGRGRATPITFSTSWPRRPGPPATLRRPRRRGTPASFTTSPRATIRFPAGLTRRIAERAPSAATASWSDPNNP